MPVVAAPSAACSLRRNELKPDPGSYLNQALPRDLMRIVLTNDDGIYAPGLEALYAELLKLGVVDVVAPSVEQSGVSHSITYLEPLLAHDVFRNGKLLGRAVRGSPADCVKLAMLQFCNTPPDLVVSGKIKVNVETVLPLHEARKAQELSQKGHAGGKIVLEVRTQG